MSEARRAAGAVLREQNRKADRGVRELEYAEVTRASPLRAKVHGRNIRLDDDDLVLGQWLSRYQEDTGIVRGDTLVVKRMRGEGDWIAVDVISATPPGGVGVGHTHTIDEVTGLQAALDLKAPLASPHFTGIPTAPTALPGTATNQLATTAFVTDALAASGDSSYAANVGDGINDAINVTHNLDTTDVSVTVRRIATGQEVLVENAVVDPDTIQLRFENPPTVDQFRVIVQSGVGGTGITSYSVGVGDGTSTNINVGHALGSQDVSVTVRRVSTGQEVLVENATIDDDVVQLRFTVAPTTNEFRVTVQR